ncbi:1-deoxy-D-xylulose-5-phosphate reductoisomerase [Neomegalonema sp.]|uniref:1-deoxy-D-xylulose-5-phosphate reductoisomerase n=1 Tax=Neomegalonema sp. TaxID=2039713 RepID=UPI0026223D39|nr:1-deoxy-D-xylulose-5-phosphate reductoisomerase [Neomegalonema sp.]MDD2869869.1 1-deoxy-D-xylulose-5-phosphate reductoisomerase [Neomegalonema sp.]
MTRRRVTLMGSTGSVGANAVDVIRRRGGIEAYEVVALTGGRNVAVLAEQARELRPELTAIQDEAAWPALKEALAGEGLRIEAGDAAVEAAGGLPADWRLAAIVGAAGLRPSLAAARAGGVLALANKECLVAAGEAFLAAVEQGGGKLIPVDSEHSALFQIFEADQIKAVDRLIVTASGGPFREWSRERMDSATPEQAAAHPNWSMGLKISVDSASLFNKALEVIEAARLFPVRPDQIEVLVHPQSVVHAMVGYADGSVLAHLGAPDMRTPIAYALGWPERIPAPTPKLDFAALSRLDFQAPDEARFPALRLAREVLEAGGLAPCALNGAKEAALEAFLERRIGFLDMAAAVEATLEALAPGGEAYDLQDVFAMDARARRFATDWTHDHRRAFA